MGFEVGDRVRVKAECAGGYTQPWRGRFEAGREGTVVREIGQWCGHQRWKVKWDSHRKPKYPTDWDLDMRSADLEPVEPE